MSKLVPPPEFAHFAWHWLRAADGHFFIAMWLAGWWCCGMAEPFDPDGRGVSYHKPADPN
jgi:hypothetical protein